MLTPLFYSASSGAGYGTIPLTILLVKTRCIAVLYRQKEKVEGREAVSFPSVSWRDGDGEGNVCSMVKEAVN